MRVLFDAFWWDDGPIANRTVQREFIRAWHRLFPDDDLVLALRRSARGDDVPRDCTVVRTHLWPHAISNHVELPGLARRASAAVVIAHNYAPRRGPSLTFIHDAMFVEHPEWFSSAERLYFRPMLPWSRLADVVATSTRTEAARIARLTSSRHAPVVTGLGIAPGLLASVPRRPPALPDVDAFAVTVGRLNVRKNLARILEAATTATRITARSPLVVVGTTAHSGVNTEFTSAVQRAIDDGRIIPLGRADDDELAWLYSHASLAISLSLDEGFGMPATEAAQFDAPLLASDIPVFRETVGEYAHFIAPDATPATIGDAIDVAWGGASDGAAVRSAYSWDAAAATMRAAVEDAHQRRMPRRSRT